VPVLPTKNIQMAAERQPCDGVLRWPAVHQRPGVLGNVSGIQAEVSSGPADPLMPGHPGGCAII
jgi:hypothetical protein